MPLLTLDEARAQCRVESDYPAEQIQPYIDGAESDAAAYLNRALFAKQADLDAAMDAVPTAVAAASTAYAAAVVAADAITDINQKQAALDIAEARMQAARDAASMVTNGVVANPAILTAVRLTLSNLFTNREAVVLGVAAVELPLGARTMLRHFRRTMMP